MVITNEFVFFWKSPLGQWNKTPFKDNENITYNCTEQYMMIKKALLFNKKIQIFNDYLKKNII